jgi:hypothetical protein
LARLHPGCGYRRFTGGNAGDTLAPRLIPPLGNAENKTAARFPGRLLAFKKEGSVSSLLLLLGDDLLHSLFRGGFLSDNFLNGLFGFGHGMCGFFGSGMTLEECPRALGALCAAQRQHQ